MKYLIASMIITSIVSTMVVTEVIAPEPLQSEIRVVYAEAIPEVALEVEKPLEVIVEPQTETYEVTAYCACEICCGEWADGFTYSGDLAVEGITAAADLSKLPLGTVVNIEGWGERTIQDIGGAIKGNRIDLYFWNHADALAFGVQELEVEIVE